MKEENIIYYVCFILLSIILLNYFLNSGNNDGYCSNIYYDKTVNCKFVEEKLLCICGNISFDPTTLDPNTQVFIPILPNYSNLSV